MRKILPITLIPVLFSCTSCTTKSTEDEQNKFCISNKTINNFLKNKNLK